MSAGLGVVEWFRPGDHSRVEASLERLRRLGCSRLRTHLSWADYHAEGGRDWYDWLLPRLAGEVELLPCLHYTPPSLSETGAVAGPPRSIPSASKVAPWHGQRNPLDDGCTEQPSWLQ